MNAIRLLLLPLLLVGLHSAPAQASNVIVESTTSDQGIIVESTTSDAQALRAPGRNPRPRPVSGSGPAGPAGLPDGRALLEQLYYWLLQLLLR